jgi:hypothetical protein
MKYAAEMGSGAMIYIPSFMKLIQAFKSCQGGYIYINVHTHTNRHTENKVVS